MKEKFGSGAEQLARKRKQNKKTIEAIDRGANMWQTDKYGRVDYLSDGSRPTKKQAKRVQKIRQTLVKQNKTTLSRVDKKSVNQKRARKGK